MSKNPALPWSAALLERFGFETPSAFRLLEARGLFQWSEEFRYADVSQPGDYYLWFNDMEWFAPDKLRKFEFQSFHKEGFIPFAHTGAEDYWCRYPAMKKDESVPVLLCNRDCYFADMFAPNFPAALFRHALEYATDPPEDELVERSGMLKRFAVDLGAVWPDVWRIKIESVAAQTIGVSEYNSEIAAEFGEPYVGHFQVRWMKEEIL